MIIGTNHFVSLESAVRYFKDQYSRGEVMRKVADKEIAIGRPALKPDDQCTVMQGRYIILTED